MWYDVLKLRGWYHGLQGRLVARVIRRALLPMLPEDKTESYTLGLGYSHPYLPNSKEKQQSVMAMPPEIGAVAWPEGGKNRTALIGEDFPFSENTFDCILLCHHLEFAPNPDQLLETCWHALRPDGRLVVMVPNRAGAWARRDSTIFAHGQPYTAHQLEKLLRRNGYKITQSRFGLFFPPINWRPLLKFYETFEKIGERWRAPVGGVILMQAQKDVFGMTVVHSNKNKRRKMVQVPAGATECRKQDT